MAGGTPSPLFRVVNLEGVGRGIARQETVKLTKTPIWEERNRVRPVLLTTIKKESFILAA